MSPAESVSNTDQIQRRSWGGAAARAAAAGAVAAGRTSGPGGAGVGCGEQCAGRAGRSIDSPQRWRGRAFSGFHLAGGAQDAFPAGPLDLLAGFVLDLCPSGAGSVDLVVAHLAELDAGHVHAIHNAKISFSTLVAQPSSPFRQPGAVFWIKGVLHDETVVDRQGRGSRASDALFLRPWPSPPPLSLPWRPPARL